MEVTRLVLPGPDGPVDVGPDAVRPRGKPVARRNAPDRRRRRGRRRQRPRPGLAQPPDAAAVAALLAAHRGKTFFEAFSATLAWLLGGTVPVFDAANPSDKPALVPLACRLVRERAEVKRLLSERDAALEAAGHPLQVKTDPAALPLFARVGGDRLLLLETGSRLSLKGRDGTFEAEEVVERFASGAWLPSFSALTRPLAASVLFPVAATILGPAEIAYWAQAWPLFSWAGIVPPVPRSASPRRARAGRHGARPLEARPFRGGRPRGRGGDAPEEGRRRGADAPGTSHGDPRERAPRARRPKSRRSSPSTRPSRRRSSTTREKTSFAFEKLVEKTAAAAGRADEQTAAQVHRLARRDPARWRPRRARVLGRCRTSCGSAARRSWARSGKSSSGTSRGFR